MHRFPYQCAKLDMLSIVVSATVQLITVLLVFAGVDAAETQLLSRITPERITKLIPLPPGVSAYDPAAECGYPDSPLCERVKQARKLCTVSNDGNLQMHECEEMRSFSFRGMPHLQLVAGICQRGPFTLPELNQTKTQARRLIDLLSKQSGVAKSENPQFLDQVLAVRTVSVGSGASAHIFTVFLVSTGFLFGPTTVVTTPSRASTFVIQLLFAPRSETKDPTSTWAEFLSRTNEALEALAKDLYKTTK